MVYIILKYKLFYCQSPKKGRDEAPGIIKIGDKAIDNHCMRSTMQGETAAMVDKFRQLKLKEFYEIDKMCELQGIPLNKKLLERGINKSYFRRHFLSRFYLYISIYY